MSPSKRTAPLSRGEIAQAALAMVDRDGVDAFSMRRLAQDLGVTTMAVYHHFVNKAEILQAAADQVWIEAVLSMSLGDDPVENVLQGFLATRRAFQAHPDVTPYAFASPSTEDAVHVMALGISEQFKAAGFQGDHVGEAYFALATYTLGSSLLYAERAMLDRRIRQPVSDLADLAPEALARQGDEAYRSVRDALGDDPGLARFEGGLRTIMAGLLARFVPDRER